MSLDSAQEREEGGEEGSERDVLGLPRVVWIRLSQYVSERERAEERHLKSTPVLVLVLVLVLGLIAVAPVPTARQRGNRVPLCAHEPPDTHTHTERERETERKRDA